MKKPVHIFPANSPRPCRLLFVMGDVGGARAMLPVINTAVTNGYDCHVLEHGYVCEVSRVEGANYHRWENGHVAGRYEVEKYTHSKAFQTEQALRSGTVVDLASMQGVEELLLDKVCPDIVAFTSSVSDKTALRIADVAAKRGLGTAHLLDYWANYTQRLELGNGLSVSPDIYAVLDEVAYDSALSAGLPESILLITGSPVFESFAAKARYSQRQTDPLKPELVFVSEPVTQDQASGSCCATNRGYTERSVLRQLLAVLNRHCPDCLLHVFAHPRENATNLEQYIDTVKGCVQVRVVRECEKNTCLTSAAGVIGMSSMLLYETWLRGYPVLSLQPELTLDTLRHLSGRSGLCFVDKSKYLDTQVRNWLADLPAHSSDNPDARRALDSHCSASALFVNELKLLYERSGRQCLSTADKYPNPETVL